MDKKCPVCNSENIGINKNGFYCEDCNYKNNKIRIQDYHFLEQILNSNKPFLELINSIKKIEEELKIIKKNFRKFENKKLKK